jgi:hypothetical protein
MDSLIFIKHFAAKVVINFVLISINLFLIIKLFVAKAFTNLFNILLDLLIHLKIFVAKLVLTSFEIAVNLCSKVGKAVMYLLIMSTKMWRFWSLNNFVRLMAFLILLYQIISVTISYSQFETVIDMKATSDLKHEPTITLCLKNGFEFPEVPQSIVNKILFNNTIGCRFTKDGASLTPKCSKLTKIVESVTTVSQRCRSYFSQLFDNKSMPILTEFYFFIDNNISAFALIHQKKTPPHFAKPKIEISKSTVTSIDYTRVVTKLLPFPYSTDCYDYGNEENAVLNYKSREDCIVKHLEKKEFNECGCNKRWFYGYSRRQNLSNICEKSIECKFNAKSEMKSLEIICKNNCLNEYFTDIFDFQNEVKEFSALNVTALTLTLTPKHEILFTHLPKMNLIEYLCSVGGLIGMWFGFSVYDLVLILAKESKKNILLLLVSMNCRFFITAIVKLKEIISSKFNHIFSSITIIVFSTLMLIQVKELISNYFDNEVVTRFDVQQIKLIPNVMLSFTPPPNLKALEIISKMKLEIPNSKFYRETFKYSEFSIKYHKYLVQLLIDNRLNDFLEVSKTGNFIISCQIKIFDDIELKNCTPGEFGILNVGFESILMNQRFDFLKLIDENKVEKITFRFNSSLNKMFAIFYSTSIRSIPQSVVSFTSNTKTTASFSTFLTKKLQSNENKCISEENQKGFNEDYFEYCDYNCIVDKVNHLCGCVPVFDMSFFFNRHFLKNNYRLCENCSVSLDNSTVFSINNQCDKNCKPKCNSLNFDTKIQVSKHVSNKTILEIIPMKTPRIVYIETWKTDFDRLIYNCGGILGLWFGITPIKAVNLIEYIPKIYRILINVCATVFQSLIAFWMRIKQK